MTTPQILTIGHSNHSFDRLASLLLTHNVTAVADVRSSPYSRINPDFNREFLEQKLRANGIAYVFLGRELGARPANRSYYENGRVQFRRLSQSPDFKEGLRRVLEGSQSYRLVLLCAEAEPLACHRTLLVARELAALAVPVAHIHADGTLESHAEAMTRLLRVLGKPDMDLYRSNEEIIEDACTLQEKRIAYTDDDMREASA